MGVGVARSWREVEGLEKVWEEGVEVGWNLQGNKRTKEKERKQSASRKTRGGVG